MDETSGKISGDLSQSVFSKEKDKSSKGMIKKLSDSSDSDEERDILNRSFEHFQDLDKVDN